jgi:hypothetical protein
MVGNGVFWLPVEPNRKAIEKEHGIEAVVEAMRAYPATDVVQTHACLVIANVAYNG